MDMGSFTPSQITTPVLVIGFNRPDKMTQLLNCLLDFGVRKIFVSLDGPRNLADEIECKKTRLQVNQFSNSFDLHLVWRDQNLGCNLGVVAALDWFFEENEFGIVLEDDCLPERSMFEMFKDKSRVLDLPESNIGLITAHNPFKTWISEQTSDYILIQGWATSSRIWKQVRVDFFKLNLPQIRKGARGQRTISESIFWWANSTRARLGVVDTWDGIFYDRIWRSGLKTWVPARNRIANSGFDERATHTKDPFGSIFVEIPANSKKDFDRALREHYFRIKRRHAFTAPVKVLFDLLRMKSRNFESVLSQDLLTRHYSH